MPRSAALLLLLLALGCRADDGPSTAATDAASTTASTAATSATDSASSTSAATATATATGESTTSATTGGAVACTESLTCPGGQVCVLPCCGGPAPACTEVNARGKCDSGDTPLPADQCSFPCSGPLCCPPYTCTPDPPFCTDASDLQCTGTKCSLDSCFGDLTSGKLECMCA